MPDADLDTVVRWIEEAESLLNRENLLGAPENAGLSIAEGMAALLDHPGWRRRRDPPLGQQRDARHENGRE